MFSVSEMKEILATECDNRSFIIWKIYNLKASFVSVAGINFFKWLITDRMSFMQIITDYLLLCFSLSLSALAFTKENNDGDEQNKWRYALSGVFFLFLHIVYQSIEMDSLSRKIILGLACVFEIVVVFIVYCNLKSSVMKKDNSDGKNNNK